MFLNIVIRTSVFVFCFGNSTKSAVSSKNFYQEDLNFFYDYSTVDFENNLKFYRHKKEHVSRPQRHANLQYAPLSLNPIDEVNISTFDTKTKTPDTEDKPESEVTTRKHNIEPLFYEQYNIESNKNGPSLQHFDGHHIKKVYNSQLRSETENNYGYADRNAHINIRSNIFQYSNNIISKQRQLMTPIPRNLPNTNVYAPQSPVKHIMQGLQALENTKIEPVLNPYYVKIPRVHLNIAHGRQIAQKKKKALENGNLKRIHLNKHKHKFVPDIDVLLYQKSFLYPEKSLKTNF